MRPGLFVVFCILLVYALTKTTSNEENNLRYNKETLDKVDSIYKDAQRKVNSIKQKERL